MGQAKLALPVYNLPTSILLVIAASLCFSNSYDGDFVFDDSEAIVNNEDVRSSPLLRLFRDDFWGTDLTHSQSHKSYRPLTILSFRLHYWLKGSLESTDFHLVNVALHSLACVVTLFAFEVLLEWKEPQLAFYSTMLFAVHPVHAEAVSGIVGRADILSGIFMWLSLLSYYKSIHSKSIILQFNCLFLCITNCAIAMFCKETGITILGVCMVYDLIIVNNILPVDLLNVVRGKYSILEVKKFMSSKISLLVRCSVLSVAAILLLLLRFGIMGFSRPKFEPIDNPASFLDNIFLRIVNYNYIYCLNLWLLLCPDWLCFDWSMGCVPLINGVDPRLSFVILFWLILGGIISVLFSERDHQLIRYVALGFSLLAIPFLPASNLFFRVGFVLAERTLYIPSAGYCLLVTLGFQKLFANVSRPKLVALFFCGLLLVFSGRSWLRSEEWRTEASLFHSGLRVCPLNAKVHYNVAKNAADRGFIEYAKLEYKEAIRLNPNYAQAMNNLGNLYKDERDYVLAEKLLRRATTIKSDFAAAWMNLGIVLSAMDRHEEAEDCYVTAVSHRRTYPDCYYNLGLLYLRRKEHEKALKAWAVATIQKPTHRRAWINTIILLDNLDKHEEALKAAQRALTHIPMDAALHFNMGNVLGKRGNFELAEQHFKTAISLDPKDSSYYTNLGVLYHRWGKPGKAEAMYRRALKLRPNSNAAHENLNRLLRKQS